MNTTYAFGPFVLEPAHRRLARRSGEPVSITSKALDVLVYLVERAGRVVERDELIRGVWPGRLVEDNNLSQVVLTMRRALGDTGSTPVFVATVPRRGYQFIAEVISPPCPVTTRLPESTPLSAVAHVPRSARPRRAQASRRTWVIAAFAVLLTASAISALLRERPIEHGAPGRPGASAACSDSSRSQEKCAPWREIESAFQRQRQLGLQTT